MTATAPVLRTESVTAAVKGLAARCDGPTLATLTAAGDTVTARPETLPGGAQTADSIAATCAAMARLIARHPAMLTADVAGYAVILPGERFAFAADRTGVTHHIQLPGVPTESLRADRWDAMIDSIAAMITAATH
ncbi:hypothetical protein [Actinoplanes auranticolor]|uniref:Uncharacterized protein n=1 Tax=Actinoplanes auranticolor TaxID=47988 RepID=A0A919VLF5_9ACTN|nr:hypothetical protein [Actinoplanes auranticolor]GIM67786.1 hypothetical protein Aau02nite_28870 [Actinoplanes auranticolor]